MTANDQPLSQRLLRECRDLLEHDLGELIEELGPVIAEDLSSLISTTRDDLRKREYVRLRGDLQERWDTLLDAFRDELARQVQPARVADTPTALAPRFSELQLVDDRELTEHIVMREFVGRVSEACSEEIYALDRRIAHLHGREQLDAADNRCGAPAVCAAVGAGCTALCKDLDIHTLLLRQIERHLCLELPVLYRAMNELLVEAGILPQLKRSYRHAPPSGTVATSGVNVMSTLQRLAQARMPGGTRVSGGGGGGQDLQPGMVAISAAFLESLQAFQVDPTFSPSAPTNVVRLARDSAAARQVQPLEAITLDIVSTLFDLIFDDDKVPDIVKGLVSRLQIPVLKVALLDQQFFADRSHPARRFLDSISGVAIRWGKTVNEGDPFYVKLSELIKRIQDSFDQDTECFGKAITELADFVSSSEAIEAETSRALAEILQRKEEELRAQREIDATARQAANYALAPLLATRLPKTIERFLLDQWREVLYKHALASGSAGTLFHEAERLAADLVWSVSPKKAAEERKHLAALLPRLLSGLQAGLDLIGLASEERHQFLDALLALHSAAIRGDKHKHDAVADLTEVASPAEEATAVVLHVTNSEENGIQIEEVSLPEAEDAADVQTMDRTSLRRVKHLVRGDWVEFVGDDGQSRRERLTWISPRRTLYLFSNHASKCAISITPEALAYRLLADTARLVERNAPLFERALDDAIKSLDFTREEAGG